MGSIIDIYQCAVRHRIKIKTKIRISKLNLISGPMVDFYLNYALKDRRLRIFLKAPLIPIIVPLYFFFFAKWTASMQLH